MKKILCTLLLLSVISTSSLAQYSLDYFPTKPTLKDWATFLAKDKLQYEDDQFPWQKMVEHFLKQYKGEDCRELYFRLPNETWDYRVTFNQKHGYFQLALNTQLCCFLELAIWNLSDGGKAVVINQVECIEGEGGTEEANVNNWISSWYYDSKNKYLARQVPNNDLFQDLLESYPGNMFELPFLEKNIKFNYIDNTGTEYMQELVLDRKTGLWELGPKYTHQ